MFNSQLLGLPRRQILAHDDYCMRYMKLNGTLILISSKADAPGKRNIKRFDACLRYLIEISFAFSFLLVKG